VAKPFFKQGVIAWQAQHGQGQGPLDTRAVAPRAYLQYQSEQTQVLRGLSGSPQDTKPISGLLWTSTATGSLWSEICGFSLPPHEPGPSGTGPCSHMGEPQKHT
jgi:hypothetical protein